MKITRTIPLLTVGVVLAALNSCVYYSNPVPDIPHHATPAAPVTPAAATPAPVKPVATPAKPAAKPAPKPAAKPAKPAAKPAATPKPAKPAASSTITQPVTPAVEQPVTPTAAPAPAPAPAPKPAQDPSLITNDGPIPYATPVPGDPTRVYNPLDPSVRIRIVNKKTGKPYPRGTKLKVKGTNFHFYVP